MRDAAGIEPSYASRVYLIARYMQVAVQHHVSSSRSTLRRDVHKVVAHPSVISVKKERPRRPIITISPHHPHRYTELLKFHECLRPANVAEVPDFIGTSQTLWQSIRINTVGVGDNCDAHGSQVARWRCRCQPSFRMISR